MAFSSAISSPVAICNIALGHLNVRPITGFEENTNQSNKCKQFYAPCRDSVIEDALWPFAMKTVPLDITGIAPVAQYGNSFVLPTDHIRVVTASYNHTMRPPADWVVEFEPQVNALCILANRARLAGQDNFNVMADSDGPLYTRYLFRQENIALYTPGFAFALAARIAAELAMPLTENANTVKNMWDMYQSKLESGGSLGTLPGRSRRTESGALVAVR